jgi:acyl-CoA thioester hydrolase
MSDAPPFVTPPLSLEPEWIDYNGHLNMAYYHVLFDRSVDAALDAYGLGTEHRNAGGGTFFTVEVHVRYLAEVNPDALVRVSVRLAGHDAKRLHVFLEMRDAIGGMLHATSEQLLLHVDPATRRVAAFAAPELAKVRAWADGDAALPPLDGLGNRIALPHPKP